MKTCPSCGYDLEAAKKNNIEPSDPICLGCLAKIYGIQFEKRRGKSLGLTLCCCCNESRHCFEVI